MLYLKLVMITIFKNFQEEDVALKYSKQRAMIKDFLQGRKDHPTAEVVYNNIREIYPKISLGTVYRNLVLLSDIGEIARLRVGDGYEHFDADTSEHNHFVCSKCGRVIDLEMDDIGSIDKVAARNFPGKIDGHKIYFYGICEDCLKENSDD
ncbi:Fur family transcriptional regulator, peroxide stress response regulator [Butyrivibrio hungatei DSM 14810]|uniref:Fur family transcriptional regulator, peroxide stress response regulator n=1 Tax=Butyrivibrio hungatei DSM 14810 TaxID=1121132 RepID=A0A1M7SRJ9_9FIRM|nr:Fur family transcriptional regulator, peroxide stress response regulator [Butyrivibrio hungatei DSM 14810]